MLEGTGSLVLLLASCDVVDSIIGVVEEGTMGLLLVSCEAEDLGYDLKLEQRLKKMLFP